jgi:hypothetical protein
MEYLSTICATVVAATFAVSILGKVRSRSGFYSFASAIRKLPVAAARWPRSSATLVLVVQGACIPLIAVPMTRIAGSLLAILVLVGFIIVIGVSLRRGSSEPCHCFGGSHDRPMSTVDVARNLLLVAVAGIGVVGTARVGVDASPIGLTVAVAAGLAVAGAIVFLNDLVWLLEPDRSELRYRGSSSDHYNSKVREEGR